MGTVISTWGPVDFGGIHHKNSRSSILDGMELSLQELRNDSILSAHSNIMSAFFSYPESGLSPKLISPPTPAMYKYRPAFSNNPKVHYHAAAEQVSELQ